MRIGIDTRLHAYAPGGISRYARRLAMEMRQLLPSQTLTLISHRRETELLNIPDSRRYRAWTPPHHRWERYALGTELLPLKLDVLHSTDFVPPAWGARRFVITVHDLNFLYYPEYLTEDARRYYNDQIVWAVEKADAILADSYATQVDLERLLGVPKARVTVTHLAADACFQPFPQDIIQAALMCYDLQPGYLLFVGTWEPRKNLPGLLEALAQMHAQGEKRTLVIAGRPGWLYDEIFERVQALHLDAWVRFIERVPLDDLVALYNGALLLAMPSFYEGFGLPALEAMQCGTPVMVAERASLPEIVGEAGLLVDPDNVATITDACLQIAQDENLRNSLREMGLAQAQNFTWAETARKTLAVYEACV